MDHKINEVGLNQHILNEKIEDKISDCVTHKKVNIGLQIYVRKRKNKM